MSARFWHDACNAAIVRQREDVTVTWGSVVVIAACFSLLICAHRRAVKLRRLRLFTFRTPPRQSAAFLVCAAASGWLFWLWRRLDVADRQRVWKHYGWFSGLMCVGCCIKALSNQAWTLFLVQFYSSERPVFTNSTIRGGPEDIKATLSYAEVRAVASLLPAAQLRWA